MFAIRLAAALVLALMAACPLCASDILLHGRVVDENEAPVSDARVSVTAVTGFTNTWKAQTDHTGLFLITLPSSGDFRVNVTREGYYELKDQIVRVDSAHEVTLVINSVREVFQSENVNAETSPVDVEQTQSQERLTGTEVNDLFYENSHSLRNALTLMPATVLDASGSLHVNGSAENQVLYLLNGFDLTNPISGQFQTVLAVEGIRSLDLTSGRSSPEFGKGAAGALAINTENGTDAFHYTASDFIPGIDIHQGVRLGNWYPRVGVSGPILRGRAWFSDTFISEYTQALVAGLPNGQNTRYGWEGSNLLHTQLNLTPSNILFADFLVDISNQGRLNLGPLNPVSTTTNDHSHQYFSSIKDQHYFGHGALLEFGFAHDDYFIAQLPQGDNLYVFSPVGNSGNYFINSLSGATRNELLVQAFLPKFAFLGSHQISVGTDSDWLSYNADYRRTGYEVLGLSNQLLSETLFPTPAKFTVGDGELSAYALDTWRFSKRLQFNLGLREDHDRKLDATAWSPRLAFSWSPFEAARTRIAGGYAVTHDAATMQMLGLPLDQTAVTTTYNPNGTPIGPPATATYSIGKGAFSLPSAANWTFDADHQLTPHLVLTAKLLWRRSSDGFSFLNTLAPDAPPSLLPLPSPQSAAVYQLTNLRHDDYRAVSFSIHQTLTAQHEWMLAYTHSRNVSNALIDPNSPVPLQILPNSVPVPWDIPNRLLGWAYLPLPWKKWAVTGLADMRSGFPFSVRDQSGQVVGAVDSYRYPIDFDLNIAIERMVTIRNYRFALRGGMDNITDQANFTAVNTVIGAPQYLQFLGKEGRHFVVRIRFFGRATTK